MHEIPTPKGMTDTEFINKISDLADKYEANEANAPDYDLGDANCASWVDKLLEEAGGSDADREEAGEMDGMDWGEEQGKESIPCKMFD